MSEEARIPNQQIDRILKTIEHVMQDANTPYVTRELVERIVGIEVEFQFVDDRRRVQERIREVIDGHLAATLSVPDGGE